MDELIEQMKKLLADVYAYGLKAQNFHWNVEGPDFIQYHGLFSDVYEKAAGDVDKVAEHIRALDAYAPASFSRFQELTSIKDETTIPIAIEMVNRLYQDNMKVLTTVKTACATAEELKQHGVLNFLEGLIDEYEKQAWMLRSTVKRTH
jgi:starvation-inducible DNA-binding protein